MSGPKHKMLVNNMNGIIQDFLTSYSDIFYEQIMKKQEDEINEILEEKYSKKYVIFKNYFSQIAEMECMMKSDEDNNHQESIEGIIKSLEEDKEKELEKLEDEYTNIINKIKTRNKEESLSKNTGIEMIEEKLKMNMLGVLNDIISNSKK